MIGFKLNIARIRSLINGDETEQQIDEELMFHLEMRIQENIANGMTPTQAQADALKRFGNFTKIRKSCLEINGCSNLTARKFIIWFALGALMAYFAIRPNHFGLQSSFLEISAVIILLALFINLRTIGKPRQSKLSLKN